MHQRDQRSDRRFQFRALTTVVAVLCLVAPPIARRLRPVRPAPEPLPEVSAKPARTTPLRSLLLPARQPPVRYNPNVDGWDDPMRLKHLQRQQIDRAMGKREVLPERAHRSVLPRTGD